MVMCPWESEHAMSAYVLISEEALVDCRGVAIRCLEKSRTAIGLSGCRGFLSKYIHLDYYLTSMDIQK
jgi:hypothetical protein